LVQVLCYMVASQVSQRYPETLGLTEAMLWLLAVFALAAYTSLPGTLVAYPLELWQDAQVVDRGTPVQ
jgi:hypothetical protein